MLVPGTEMSLFPTEMLVPGTEMPGFPTEISGFRGCIRKFFC